MKNKLFLFGLVFLTGCQTYSPKQYVANMYAKGTLGDYDSTGSCPGCHVKKFDRAKLTVNEVLAANTRPIVVGCDVSVIDSLDLINVSEIRYIPAVDETTCITVFEKEKSYLKAMGFSE